MPKRHILICTPIYPPDIGGPATYTKELCERIAGEFEITVLTYADKKTAVEFPNTKLIVINKNLPMPLRLTLYTLKLFSISRKFDCIYVQNAVASGLPVAINKIIFRTPYILKFVGDEAWERATQRGETKMLLEEFLEAQNPQNKILPTSFARRHAESQEQISAYVKLLLKIQGIVLREATIVTTPSLYLGETLVKNYGVKQENFLVNYNASVEEERVINTEIQKHPHQICFTGRLTAWKNVSGILDAVKILQSKYPDINFVAAGDGPELENLKKKVIELNLEGNIKFLGRVSRDETYKLRKESSIYILNSNYEGLPHTALTTFQAGIPIIATDTPGTNEAVYNEISGLLIPMNDSQALANAVERLFVDNANGGTLSKKLIDGGTKILHEKFSWDAHIKNLKMFFEKISKKISVEQQPRI